MRKLLRYILSYPILCLIVLGTFVVGYGQYHKENRQKIILNSPYGDSSPVHPKVLLLNKKGYKYWMSFTPYPKHNSKFENPCIAVSNDLVNWICPVPGMQEQVLDDLSYNTDNKIYNSDAHLIFDEQKNRIECWWRYVDDNRNYMCLYRRTSSDGLSWSPKEIVIESKNRKAKDYVSPAIIKDKNGYHMWYVDKRKIFYIFANGNLEFGDRKVCLIDYGNLAPWHIDVVKDGIEQKMIFVGYDKKSKDHNNMKLYYINSCNNIEWSRPNSILEKRKGDYWDNLGLYRSTFLKEDNEYKILYGAFGVDDKVGIGLIKAKEITKLE